MAIKKFYTEREKKHWKYDARQKKYWSWGYDIRLNDGKRIRESGFATESDAVAAIGRIRQAEKDKKYGFIPDSAIPTFKDLIEKRLASIKTQAEKIRATRVLHDFAALLPANIKVNALNSPHFALYTERRLKDGVKPQSINREFNIIAAAINSAKRRCCINRI